MYLKKYIKRLYILLGVLTFSTLELIIDSSTLKKKYFMEVKIMKKFISTFSILLLILIFGFVSSTSVLANSITHPYDVPGYDSPNYFPLSTSNLLGDSIVLDKVLISSHQNNNSYYRILRYEMPVYCLIGLESGEDYYIFTAGSTRTLTYTESRAINTTYSEQVSNMYSLSLSSSLGEALGFSNVEMNSSLPSCVTNNLEIYNGLFSYTATQDVSYTSNYNIIVSGKYRLEKRAFLYVYVIQYYSELTYIDYNKGPWEIVQYYLYQFTLFFQILHHQVYLI